MPVNGDEALIQIRRMRQLTGYPKSDNAAEDELLRMALKYAKDLRHLGTEIGEWIEQHPTAAKPSDLRQILRGPEIGEYLLSSKPRVCPTGECDGSGWIQQYALITEERNPGGLVKRKETLTEQQFMDLRSKVDGQSQRLYEGAKKCSCFGKL